MPWTGGSGGAFPDYDQTTTPVSPSSGEFWWDRNVHVLKRYNGTSWDWVGLDDLSNVDTTGKSDSNILEWDTTPTPDAWIAATKPSGGGSPLGAQVRQASTGTTLPNATPTVITWDTEVVDDDNMVDLVASNNRITIQTGGRRWLITGTIEVSGTAVQAVILVNGTYITANSAPSAPTSNGQACVTIPFDLAASDYVQLRGFQQSGVSVATTAANYRTSLSVQTMD